MSVQTTHAVTGAFGYTGKYITRKLLDQGLRVITLTNSEHRNNEFGDKIRAFPFHFDQPDELTRTLQGVEVLYNTYWVRFNHKLFKHEDAVQNTRILFNTARKAGVRRIVHVSITNPSETSPLEYFRGKAVLERALMESGISYCILRPAVIFGREDILVNNIAWALRRLPVFGVFGDGQYRLQPIFVDDLADLAVKFGPTREEIILNAIGPETFSYRGLVATIGRLIGAQRPILSVSPTIGYLAGRMIGGLVGDVLITREEIEGLMGNLLYVDTPPTGTTKMTEWGKQHSATLGLRYASELVRRKDRITGYSSN